MLRRCVPVRACAFPASLLRTAAMTTSASYAVARLQTPSYSCSVPTTVTTSSTMMMRRPVCPVTTAMATTTACPTTTVGSRRWHGSAPSPDMPKWKYYLYVVWDGIRHLVHGFRLFYVNTKLAWKYSQRLRQGSALTRRERALLEVATADLLRLVPFSFFIIVPGAELLLPVCLKMFPDLIPSTFETEAQGKNKAFQRAAATMIARRRLIEHMTTQVIGSGEVIEVLRRASCGDALHTEHIRLLAPICGKEGPLSVHKVPYDILTALATTIGVWRPWYYILPKSFIAPRLRTAILNHYRKMRQDDNLLRDEGLADLTHDELVKANMARGMRWTDTDMALKLQLEIWLRIADDRRISYNTLFWVKPTAHNLRKTMMGLPVETRRQLLGISNLPQSVRKSLERVVDHVSESREGVTGLSTDTIAETVSERKEASKRARQQVADESVLRAVSEYLTEDNIGKLFEEIEGMHGEVRMSELIDYLATDIGQSSSVVRTLFGELEMGGDKTIATRNMIKSLAARCTEELNKAKKSKPAEKKESTEKKSADSSNSSSSKTDK